MNWIKYTLYLLGVVHMAFTVHATPSNVLPNSQIEEHLYRFHLRSAEDMIPQIPGTAFKAFYQYHILAYKYLAVQSEYDLKIFRNVWGKTIQDIEKLPSEDPMRNVLLAEVYSKRAIVEFLEKNHITSLWYARTSWSLVKKNQQKFPDNVEQLKILGLFNVLFGAVPKKYQWFTRAMGFEGNVTVGINQLKKAAEKSSLLKLESIIINYYAVKNIYDKPFLAISDLERSRNSLPSSIILDYCLVTGYMSLKKNDQAYKILQKRQSYATDNQVFFIPFWDYHLAKAYYYKSKYSDAQISFQRFLQNHKGYLFRTDATFLLGMSYILSDNYPKGKEYFTMLTQQKISDLEEDLYAAYMAQQFIQKEPSTTLKALFRARNTIDGGYFNAALVILKGIEQSGTTLSSSDKTYLNYLYGRIYHTLGNLPDAKKYYLQCIEHTADRSTSWQQAYASYYVGEISKTQKDLVAAKQYFQKVLVYDNYFYQPSVESRARVALKELK